MRVVRRPKGGKWHIVYDSVEEAERNGVTPRYCRDPYLQVGEWIYYPDGVVAQVLKLYEVKSKVKGREKIVVTVLNCFANSSGEKSITSKFQPVYALGKTEIDLTEVDSRKIAFVEDWLLRGMTLEESAKKNLSRFTLHGKLLRKKNAKWFAYTVLSGSWFSKVLRKNKLIRDRYMSLISAFNQQGITDDYIAKKIKEGIESDSDKRHINALNQAIELVKEFERRKPRAIPTTFSAEIDASETKKLIDAGSVDVNMEVVNNVVKELLGENPNGQRQHMSDEVQST